MAITIEETIEDALVARLVATVVAGDTVPPTQAKPFKAAELFTVTSIAEVKDAMGRGEYHNPLALVGRPQLRPADDELMSDTARLYVFGILDHRNDRQEGARGVRGTFNLTRRIKIALRGLKIDLGALATPSLTMPLQIGATEFVDYAGLSVGRVEVAIRIPADTETSQPY